MPVWVAARHSNKVVVVRTFFTITQASTRDMGSSPSSNRIHTCNGGVALATIRGLGPGSLNIVSTSWSPTSTSISMAPGGQFGEWAGELELEKALMICPLSRLFRPPERPFWPLGSIEEVAEQSVD